MPTIAAALVVVVILRAVNLVGKGLNLKAVRLMLLVIQRKKTTNKLISNLYLQSDLERKKRKTLHCTEKYYGLKLKFIGKKGYIIIIIIVYYYIDC